MSLCGEGLKAACERLARLEKRTNILFTKLGLPLKDKIQMEHYGDLYLFGKYVNDKTTHPPISLTITANSSFTLRKTSTKTGSKCIPAPFSIIWQAAS